MKTIADLIGNEATERLKERYGVLVDRIFVEVKGEHVLKSLFQIIDYKITSDNPGNNEIERMLDMGIAEIEYALYSVLGLAMEKEKIHLDNNLPRNGIQRRIDEIRKKVEELKSD